jgi:hypothetical protein
LQLEGKTSLGEHDVRKEVTRSVTQIPKMLLCSVMDESVQGVMRHVELGGNYLA